MAGLARAFAILGAVSVIGTMTQVGKGKLGAVLLGAAGVGVLNQLTTFFGLLLIFSGFGFFNGMIRRITLAVKEGGNREARAQMNSVALFLGAASLVIAAAGLLASATISDLLFTDDGRRAHLVALVILAVPIAVQQRIFRAYLNATRDLKAISRAQIFADLSSVGIFAIGAWQFGIWGAIAAFVGMHALLLLGMGLFAVRSGGWGLALPDPRRFAWSEIGSNFGYGINLLIMASAASGTAIVIGRMIISNYDLAHAGIFAVAFKVATVYLGALGATAGSYYFPTLVGLENREDLEQEANRAVALYMAVLPPVMIGLIALGDIVIPLLFSEEFLPAVLVMAGLLLGDLFRVTSEAMGLTLLAQEKLVHYTGLFLLYTAGFITVSWILLPGWGLVGVAIAYIAMRALDFVLVLGVCRKLLGIRLNRTGAWPFALAVLAVAPIALAQFLGASLPLKLVLALAVGIAWLVLSWNLSEFAALREKALRRLKNR
ncbi:oligosaccharide flippase family protein [Qipengyuania sp. CAU 1752]